MGTLELDQLELLVYVSFGIMFLIAIGLVIYIAVSSRRNRAERDQPFGEDDVVLRPAHLVVGQILSLVRDEPGGPLKVHIGGRKYGSLAEVQDPQVKRQIVDVAMEMIQFTGVLGHGVVAPAPADKTESWREDMREGSKAELQRAHRSPVGEDLQSKAPPEVEEQFLNLLTEIGAAPAQPEPPTLADSIQLRLRPKSLETGQPRSFVSEIEEIVQRRMRLIPALLGRDLHVQPGPGGKVLFVFDGKEYEDADDIPNLTARQLIQDSIREWDETT